MNVKTLFGRMTPGTYALEVTVDEITGRLQAETPDIRFEDGLAHVKIPASIREGRGHARIRFKWESKGLAGLACGDVDVTETVSGRVRPHSYAAEGDLELSLEGDTVTAAPRVPGSRDPAVRGALEGVVGGSGPAPRAPGVPLPDRPQAGRRPEGPPRACWTGA